MEWKSHFHSQLLRRPLPDRHDAFHFVDEPLAGGECLGAMRSNDLDPERRFVDTHHTDAMNEPDGSVSDVSSQPARSLNKEKNWTRTVMMRECVLRLAENNQMETTDGRRWTQMLQSSGQVLQPLRRSRFGEAL